MTQNRFGATGHRRIKINQRARVRVIGLPATAPQNGLDHVAGGDGTHPADNADTGSALGNDLT